MNRHATGWLRSVTALTAIGLGAANAAEMKTIVSKDGTPIAYERRGQGPVVVLVHGAGSDHTGWETVPDALDDEFTVLAIDRRGRGASGDAGDYAIEREYEDVMALIGAAGESVFLLGHSFGGICAMEVALRAGRSVRKLVVYEPPTNVPGDGATVAPYDALLASGKAGEVVERFYRERVLVPDKELAMLRAAPSWPARVASAHTIPREMRAVFANRHRAVGKARHPHTDSVGSR